MNSAGGNREPFSHRAHVEWDTPNSCATPFKGFPLDLRHSRRRCASSARAGFKSIPAMTIRFPLISGYTFRGPAIFQDFRKKSARMVNSSKPFVPQSGEASQIHQNSPPSCTRLNNTAYCREDEPEPPRRSTPILAITYHFLWSKLERFNHCRSRSHGWPAAEVSAAADTVAFVTNAQWTGRFYRPKPCDAMPEARRPGIERSGLAPRTKRIAVIVRPCFLPVTRRTSCHWRTWHPAPRPASPGNLPPHHRVSAVARDREG